jgi:hypothetical protein
MKIEMATVVPGSESPAEDGQFDAIRCVMVAPNGVHRRAVLKRGDLGQIASEAFCALLLRAWGLPVPEPYLIEEGDSLAFASTDVGYPNLKQRMSVNAFPPGPLRDQLVKVAAQLAMSFTTTSLATAADEAIDNRDRNLGNILWDGSQEAWIDHAFALGTPMPDGQTQPDANKLCQLAMIAGKHVELRAAATGQALALSAEIATDAEVALPVSLSGRNHAQLVATRVQALASRIIDRFPRPNDLLANA